MNHLAPGRDTARSNFPSKSVLLTVFSEHSCNRMADWQHIFVDLDGVLADFVSGALKLHEREDHLEAWPPGEFDMARALGITSGQFWGGIDRAGACFWGELKPFPWAFELIRELRTIAPVTIATSPSQDPNCLAGKVQWLQRHFGRSFRDYLIGPPKYLLAAPGRVLIDDSDRNIHSFRDYGGKGILFPQPWNSNHRRTGERIEHVRAELGLAQGDGSPHQSSSGQSGANHDPRS